MAAPQVEGITEHSMKRFWVIFTGQAFSLFGSRLVQFTLVWWLTQTSGSASVLALTSIMALLPQVLLGPFAGSLVDRWNRKVVLMVSDGAIAVAIFVLSLLYAQGSIKIWHIYSLMFLRALLGAFQWPAFQASTSLMVSKKQLSRVAGLNQSLLGLVTILAPPLGALLFDVLPIQLILSIDIATAFIAIGPLLFISTPQPPRAPNASARAGGFRSVLVDMWEGTRFIWNWKGMRLIMGVSMVINILVNPGYTLLPILVTKHFGGGAIELAWLQSAGGLGMIGGGLILGVWGGFKKRIVTASYAITIAGFSIIVLGKTPSSMFSLAIVSSFTFMTTNAISNGTFLAIMQSTIPPGMQGRVLTLLMSLSAMMTPIGLAIAGPIADTIGVRIWFVVGGIIFMLMGVASFFTPSIIRLEESAPRDLNTPRHT